MMSIVKIFLDHGNKTATVLFSSDAEHAKSEVYRREGDSASSWRL